MRLLILVLFFVYSYPNFASHLNFEPPQVTSISCQLYGMVKDNSTGVAKESYETLVEANFSLQEGSINIGIEGTHYDSKEDWCRPFGIKSKTFTSPSGKTSLQISAWQCGPNNKMYFYQRVKLEGHPSINGPIEGKYSRIQINQDNTSYNNETVTNTAGMPLKDSDDKPITLTENTFQFILSDCEMELAPTWVTIQEIQ